MSVSRQDVLNSHTTPEHHIGDLVATTDPKGLFTALYRVINCIQRWSAKAPHKGYYVYELVNATTGDMFNGATRSSGRLTFTDAELTAVDEPNLTRPQHWVHFVTRARGAGGIFGH